MLGILHIALSYPCLPGVPSFGKADLGAEGIQKFFETHECNSICQALGLPRMSANGQVMAPKELIQRTLPAPNTTLVWDLKNKVASK